MTPPDGITFGGKLGLIQGIIITPAGDVWAAGIEKNQLIHFPKGDLTKGRIVCEGDRQEPCKSFRAPFHVAIDQQDRIWLSKAASPDGAPGAGGCTAARAQADATRAAGGGKTRTRARGPV